MQSVERWVAVQGVWPPMLTCEAVGVMVSSSLPACEACTRIRHRGLSEADAVLALL